MSTNRVALLEDNARMALLIGRALAHAGIQADVFGRIEHAWQAITQGAYAVIIVDRSVPDGDGLDLVKRLRTLGVAVPCLMVTARDALNDRIEGLESGADDYLAKPFSLEECVARVRALMRRPRALTSLTPAFAGITVLPEQGCMKQGQASATLPPAEMQILLALVQASGQVVSRGRLEAAAWGLGEGVTPNALDVAVHRLRRKIAAVGAVAQIVNLRGQGFALQAGHEGQ
ncbi:response regulator transcription factor [Candidatus Sodalis endolongispinus]|uniref:Response regulator transcription factor n=1 Tax=Candidatus Sodalis endolongispinus TaxID=2812662 RepID=A0ABS5YCV8_9GAMM|nr:response regulator transcription factor [Candidatus Sodalis endolongispinus]MBT9432864.1 response regulator transcription factor [Candidatus Sodalis endolongispinus]